MVDNEIFHGNVRLGITQIVLFVKTLCLECSKKSKVESVSH